MSTTASPSTVTHRRNAHGSAGVSWVLFAITVFLGVPPAATCHAGEESDKAKPSKKTVSISGHAFHFGPRGGRLKGAEVTVLERPDLRTLTGKRGAFRFDDLKPGSEISLILKHRGYSSVQTRTFTLGNSDIKRVSFQVPPLAIYAGYCALLNYKPDPKCSQVASTVTRVGESLYWSIGPTHGEPNATVTIDPPLPAKHGPIYFNLNLSDRGLQIIWPDRSLKKTTLDGGVLFVDVPPGEYTLRAHKPGVKFKPVRIKCRPGRFVNASPPHGLQALPRPGQKIPGPDRLRQHW